MSRVSIPLVVKMPPQVLFVGEPVRAAGWYGPTQGLHTVAIKAMNFLGRVYLEGSLALKPTDADWFSVPIGDPAYIQYPRGPLCDPNLRGESSVIGFSFNCNCLWLRVRVDRSYLVPTMIAEYQIRQLGTLDTVLINY